MKFGKLALLGALIGVATAASASVEQRTEAWGLHDPTEVGSNSISVPDTSFDDKYTFTLLSTSVLSDYALTFDISSFSNLSGSAISLYQVGNSTAIGSFAFDGLAPQHHSFGPQGAGSYFYEVTGGLASGATNGSYTFSSLAVTAVPEPASMALMMAGIGLIGFVGRRRRNNKA